MRLPWPELPSTHRPGESIRRVLDYVHWIAREMQRTGYHSGAQHDHWRVRVNEAYQALFLPVIPSFGDPYPPDVPPPRSPGIWPDIPAAAVAGMTVRHQLKVIGMLAEQLRARLWPHAREHEIQEWDRRFATARVALDHGPEVPLPQEAMTEPSAEALAAAKAEQHAIQEHARKRLLRLKRLQAKAARRRERAASGKKAKKATPAAAGAARKTKAPARKSKASSGKTVGAAKKATPKKKAKKAEARTVRKPAKAPKKKKPAPTKKAGTKAPSTAAPRKRKASGSAAKVRKKK